MSEIVKILGMEFIKFYDKQPVSIDPFMIYE